MPNLKIRSPAMILGALAITLISLSSGEAIEDDFGACQEVKSKYFSISYSPQLNPASLAQQLNIQPADEFLARGSINRDNLGSTEFTAMLDMLFLRVCSILDMPLYSFQGNLKICEDQEHLNRIYNSLFKSSLEDQKSFYVSSLNTIYICAPNMSKEVLGHEISHAIISRYFVVQPPIKAAEILAVYVEYQLRKQ